MVALWSCLLGRSPPSTLTFLWHDLVSSFGYPETRVRPFDLHYIKGDLIISEFVSTSLAFACFSAAALVARRREYLYLGGLLSSGLSILQLHSSSLRSLFKNKDFLFCVPPKCPATVGYLISPERKLLLEKNSLTEANLINPPPSFPPSSTIRLHPHEARELAIVAVKNYGNGGISFGER
ncbi:hypothetical protein JHK84_050545 [Glycine max]|nr:hypothetical protein JHK86_050488 [Glycine max]KAG5094957.1 hypothetical protein JHK84_050545 [Glycine max]